MKKSLLLIAAIVSVSASARFSRARISRRRLSG